MKERVSTITGKIPVILIAPHGNDDTNTAIIAEVATKKLNCYAVINRGFDRSDSVDVDKDLADCNRIDHVKQDVVYEEYLKPISKFVSKILTKLIDSRDVCHIFHIHGCGNAVHKEAQCQIELIMGYGLGIKKHSLTCDVSRKNTLLHVFRIYAFEGEVFSGKGGGKYAGRDSNNMNQFYRKHNNFPNVQSVQLEFPHSSRNTIVSATNTGMFLASSISHYLKCDKHEYNEEEYFI